MQSYIFRTIIEADYPNGYHGFVPLLSGVHTCGDTIKEAIICHVQGLLKRWRADSKRRKHIRSNSNFF